MDGLDITHKRTAAVSAISAKVSPLWSYWFSGYILSQYNAAGTLNTAFLPLAADASSVRCLVHHRLRPPGCQPL